MIIKYFKTLIMLLNIIYVGSFTYYQYNYHYNIHEKNDTLKNYNNDIIGTLSIENYPYKVALLKTDNNDYYLNHTLFKTFSSNGSIFLDFRINEHNTYKYIFYGHNSSFGDAPFKILENYFDKRFYEKYQCMNLSINSIVETYCVFSVYITNNNFEHLNLKFSNNESFLSHLKSLQKKSIYPSSLYFNLDSKVMVLQTCCEFSFCSKKSDIYIIVALIKV